MPAHREPVPLRPTGGHLGDNVWQQFFDGYAPRYDEEEFTRGTAAEVAFLVALLDLAPGARILDVGCGTGRHSVALASRGYRVTGLDLSSAMLARARAAAKAAAVDLELVQADATDFSFAVPFDAAVCLCEGAFTLIGADDPVEHDLAILANVRAALRPGAPFVLTALNAMRMVRAATAEHVAAGEFDPMSQSQESVGEWEDADGRHVLRLRERGYTPTELALALRLTGFAVEHVWGGTAGDWGRRPVDLDEYELMAVARRPCVEAAGAPAARRRARRRVGRSGATTTPFVTREGTPDDAPGVARLINGVIAEGAPVLLTGSFSDEEERAFLAALSPRGGFCVAETAAGPAEGAREAGRARATGGTSRVRATGGVARTGAPGGEGRAATIVAAQVFAPYAAGMVAHDHVCVMGTWVDAGWRRRGLGRALWERTAALARGRGFTRVFTDVRADNAGSLAFHRALGFSVAGVAREQAVIDGRAHDVVFVERGL